MKRKILLIVAALTCTIGFLHSQTAVATPATFTQQKLKWVLLTEQALVAQDPDVKKASYPDTQGLRLSVISIVGKKTVVERNFFNIGWMKRMPQDTMKINLKYGPNGELLRDDNPSKSGFENKCIGFVEGLPLEIRSEVILAFK